MIAAIYARKSTDQNGVADEDYSVTRLRRLEAELRIGNLPGLCNDSTHDD